MANPVRRNNILYLFLLDTSVCFMCQCEENTLYKVWRDAIASAAINERSNWCRAQEKRGLTVCFACERTSICSSSSNNKQTRQRRGVHPFSVLSGKQKKRPTPDASVTSPGTSQSGSNFTVAKRESGGGRITGRGYLTDAATWCKLAVIVTP